MIEKDKATNSVWEAFSQQDKDESNDMLPLHVLESIAKGQADIIAGRTISFDEFKKQLSISNP